MAENTEIAKAVFMILRGYVVEIAKHAFMKEHGRQPEYGEINNLKMVGPGFAVEIVLGPEDFDEEEDEDEEDEEAVHGGR